MNQRISVVINTLNEEKNIERVIHSVDWADEVVVCDMHSEDKTVALAKKLKAKVVFHKQTRYVEPARNFAISKASNEWVLLLDADEEIPAVLGEKLQKIVKEAENYSYIQIPRKNIIFGKWMKASFWWPDFHVRFFKKGSVIWNDKIHSKPELKGEGLTFPSKEEWAIVHHHYTGVFQFIERLNRYTDIQAQELSAEGYKFNWVDLINKPLSEFLGRYFANKGFEDGLYGLALSLLQAFSFLIVYLKVWEMEKFTDHNLSLPEVKNEMKKAGEEIDYWFKYRSLSKTPFISFLQRLRNKLV